MFRRRRRDADAGETDIEKVDDVFDGKGSLQSVEAEASTQVFDHPVSGRILFEEVIRENFYAGRADHAQWVFGCRITRRTGSRCRSRVTTDGFLPAAHVEDGRSRIEQYFKESHAWRKTGTGSLSHASTSTGVRSRELLAAVFDENIQPNLRRVISSVDEKVSKLWSAQPLAA